MVGAGHLDHCYSLENECIYVHPTALKSAKNSISFQLAVVAMAAATTTAAAIEAAAAATEAVATAALAMITVITTAIIITHYSKSEIMTKPALALTAAVRQ